MSDDNEQQEQQSQFPSLFDPANLSHDDLEFIMCSFETILDRYLLAVALAMDGDFTQMQNLFEKDFIADGVNDYRRLEKLFVKVTGEPSTEITFDDDGLNEIIECLPDSPIHTALHGDIPLEVFAYIFNQTSNGPIH